MKPFPYFSLLMILSPLALAATGASAADGLTGSVQLPNEPADSADMNVPRRDPDENALQTQGEEPQAQQQPSKAATLRRKTENVSGAFFPVKVTECGFQRDQFGIESVIMNVRSCQLVKTYNVRLEKKKFAGLVPYIGEVKDPAIAKEEKKYELQDKTFSFPVSFMSEKDLEDAKTKLYAAEDTESQKKLEFGNNVDRVTVTREVLPDSLFKGFALGSAHKQAEKAYKEYVDALNATSQAKGELRDAKQGLSVARQNAMNFCINMQRETAASMDRNRQHDQCH